MKRKNKKNLQKPKEEIAEDFCFVCKDGGDLLICEYKQCLKAYHFNCVKKDTSFSTSKEKWVCDWHSCMVCHKKSQVQCYCCPKATCWHCINVAEIVEVKGKFGLCSDCLKLALLVEDNRDADSDGEKVDFKDRDTYEGLFMEYYKMIQEEEGFCADKLHAAKNRLKTGENILSGSEADSSASEQEEEISSGEDMDNKRRQKNKRFKKGLPMMRCVKSKKMQFCGWGSTSLIQFLKSIGKDTSEKLSQHDVYFIIRRYIAENNLCDPQKKKRIVCDQNLQPIFRMKSVSKNKIFGLLEAHFTENLEESEEEGEAIHDSEYEDETPLMTCKTRKMSKPEKGSSRRDAIQSVPDSCYASITAENIKHVYLRRSLVYELSKQPESFERKVVGSFVRVKSDPYDYYQRNSYQLVQVTGIMKPVTGENTTEIILCVSRISKEISINFLSDADFSEEECEDLRQKVKDGLVQKPTVKELQEKARSLHVDITKHWIARELRLLDHQKDQANEKGWRREFFEYMERKRLLQTPSEQSRLLQNYPIVIPDVADVDPKNKETVDEQKLDEALQKSTLSRNHNDTPEVVAYLEPTIRDTVDEQKGHEALLESAFPMDCNDRTGGNGILNVAYLEPTTRDIVDQQKGHEALPESIFPIDSNDRTGGNGISKDEECHAPLCIQEARQNLDRTAIPVSPYNSMSTEKSGEPEPSTLQERPQQILLASSDQHEVASQIDADRSSCSASVNQNQQNNDATQATSKKQEALAAEVIVLDSDDESQPNVAVEGQALEDPESCVWFISGPDGVQRRKKYSLSLLKRWSEATTYALRFKVWKENQSQEQAIPLGDAINLAFPRK